MMLVLITSCENLNRNLEDLFGSREQTATTDGFCTYQKIIQQKGDSNIKASLTVRQRILANEARYACECEKRQDICDKLPKG